MKTEIITQKEKIKLKKAMKPYKTKMKNQRNNSSYSVDYNQLMIELRKARKNYEASTNYTDLMSLKHFCEKN